MREVTVPVPHVYVLSIGLPWSSGQLKGAFGEQGDAKNKLTCSICLKEFKSLPALNGHMRSHGGMRASPSLKQVSRANPRASQAMCCLLCFAAVRQSEVSPVRAPGGRRPPQREGLHLDAGSRSGQTVPLPLASWTRVRNRSVGNRFRESQPPLLLEKTAKKT